MLFPSLTFRKHRALVQDFTTNILEPDYSTTIIGPRSSRYDFIQVGDVAELGAKLTQRYGVDISDIPDGNLALILERIGKAQKAPKKNRN